MRSHRPRASSTASARRQARYRRPANSTGPSRSRRLVLHVVRELRGIYSNRSAVAWGAPLIRWSDDGAIVLAARPIASLLAGFSPAGMAASFAARSNSAAVADDTIGRPEHRMGVVKLYLPR